MSEPFSRGRWTAGCLIAFVAGSALNMMAIAIGLRINITIVSLLLGVLPGMVLIVMARRSQFRDFMRGMFLGACVIALLGGACGAIFTATQMGH